LKQPHRLENNFFDRKLSFKSQETFSPLLVNKIFWLRVWASGGDRWNLRRRRLPRFRSLLFPAKVIVGPRRRGRFFERCSWWWNWQALDFQKVSF